MRRAGRLVSQSLSCLVSVFLVMGSVNIPPAGALPAKPKPVRREITELRTAYSNAYDNGDGTYTYEGYKAPVNYRDQVSAQYVPIDSSIEETGPATARRWSNKANAFAISLPKRVGQSGWVSVETTRGSVSMRPASAGDLRAAPEAAADATGQLVPATASGVRYPQAFTGADIEYDSNSRGLKETIVLPSWSGASTFSFSLRTKGLRPELDVDGGLGFYSAESTMPVFACPPPSMTDSAVGPDGGAYSIAAHYGLVPDGPDWRLDVVADPSWLADPARVYPVRIDPTLYYENAWDQGDTYVAEGNPTSNYGSSTILRTGNWSEGGMGVTHTLVKPQIDPAGFINGGMSGQVDIIEANLNLFAYTTADVDVKVAQLTETWSQLGVTWNTAPSWATGFWCHVVAPGWNEFPITSIVDDWVNEGVPNYGVMVYSGDAANAAKFYSDQNTTGQPYMLVRYVPRPKLIEPGPDVPISGRPKMRWEFDAMGRTQTKAQFEIKRSGSDSILWSSGEVNLTPMQNSYDLRDIAPFLEPDRYYARIKIATTVAGVGDAWSYWTPWRPFDCKALTDSSDQQGALGYHAADDLGGGARVDLSNMRLQISRNDFAGPGTGGPLGFSLTYDSALTTDTGFGKGWRLALPSMVASDQIAPNPGFESGPNADGDPTAWEVSDTTKVSRDTAQVHTGAASLKMAFTSAFTSFYVCDEITSSTGRLTVPGQRYEVSYWVKTSAMTVNPDQPASERGVRATVNWYDDAGVMKGSSKAEGLIQTTTNGWVKRTLSAVAPKDGQRAILVIDFKNAKGTAWVDDVEWHDGTQVLTSASGTTRTLRQAGYGTYTRDPLAPELSVEAVNAALGARVSSNATASITGASVDGLIDRDGTYDSCVLNADGANYIQYDLKRPRLIDKIRMYLWDGEEDRSRAYVYYLQVNETGEPGGWRDAASSLAAPLSGTGWQTIDLDPIRVRSIRVRALNNTADVNFHIREFELPVYELSESPVSFDTTSGLLLAAADESDNVTRYRRDTTGRLAAVEETSAARGVDLTWSGTQLQRLSWRGIDSNGTPSTESNVASYLYNDAARTLSISQPGTSGPVTTAVYGYDTNNRITSVTDADGQITTVNYVSGKVDTVVRGPVGLRATAHYIEIGTAGDIVMTDKTGEGGGEVVSKITMPETLGHQPTGSVSDPYGANLITTYAYDTYGHVRSVQGPAGTDTIDADSHGSVWKVNEKGARETTATYADDRVTTSTDALGKITTYTYDECGRPTDTSVRVSEEASGGIVTQATDYDEWGNRVVDGSGGSATLNKLLNGAFEVNPTTTGWTGGNLDYTWRTVASLPFAQPYLGAYVVGLQGSDHEAYLGSDAMPVSAGTTYAVEAWGAGTGKLQIKAYNSGGTLIASPVVARTMSESLTSSTRMRRVSAAWVAPAGAVTARVFVVAATSCYAVFDNVRFEKSSSAGDDDFVDNGSFEDENTSHLPTGWTTRGSGLTDAAQERVGSSAYPPVSGGWTARVISTEADWGYFQSEWIPVTAGERYTFGGYMAITRSKNSPGGPDILLVEGDSGKNSLQTGDRPYPSATPTELTGNQPWRRYTGSYTVPADTHYLRLYARTSSVNGDVYFDALFLRPASTQTTRTFDAATHSFEVTTTTNTGRVLTAYTDGRGRERQTTFRASATSPTSTVLSANAFDGAGRLSRVETRASSNATIAASYTYTRAGRLSTVTDPNSHTSVIAYDAAGRVNKVTAPSGVASSLAYDALGRLKTTYRPGSGTSVRLAENAYDSAGRPSTTTYFNPSNVAATVSTTQYDSASRVANITLTGETAGSITSSYDGLSRLTGVSLIGPSGTASITTVYDVGDRPLSTSFTALGTSGSVTGTYARTGEWLSTSSFGKQYSFGWSTEGGLESILSDWSVTDFADDAFGRPASVRTGFSGPSRFGPYASYELSYDEFDRMSGISAQGPSLSSTDSFGYDLAGRLTSWGRDSTQTTYGYDLAGNLTTSTTGTTQTTFAYNVDDALTASTVNSIVTTYGNDVLGRRISQRSAASTTTTTYGYDSMGHLTSFRSPEASATYSYGVTGMREVKAVTRGGVTSSTSTLWSGGKPVLEKDSDGTTLRYLYGPGGLPLSVQVTRAGITSTYHYLTDALGSVAALVSEDGTPTVTYAYDPWGRVTAQGGTDSWLANRQPLRYRAYYQDAESGLYYLPARYYDPKTCRFLTPDPAASSAGDPQSLNRYAYCQDDPIALVDPTGATVDLDGNGKIDSWDSNSEAAVHAKSAHLGTYFRARARYHWYMHKAAQIAGPEGLDFKDLGSDRQTRFSDAIRSAYDASGEASHALNAFVSASGVVVDHYYTDYNVSVWYFTFGAMQDEDVLRNGDTRLGRLHGYLGGSVGVPWLAGSVSRGQGSVPHNICFEASAGAVLGGAGGTTISGDGYFQSGIFSPQASVSGFAIFEF